MKIRENLSEDSKPRGAESKKGSGKAGRGTGNEGQEE